MPGTRRFEDRELARRGRVVEERVEAAPAERVGHLARGVRREDDERRMLGLDRAELGDGDLIVGEDLEQERLELRIGAVDLVDQQHDGRLAAERLEERARDEEAARRRRPRRPRRCGRAASASEVAPSTFDATASRRSCV